MHELIFEELKIDFEDSVRQRGKEYRYKCYQDQGKGLDGARDYA